jgi:hypothetical protein
MYTTVDRSPNNVGMGQSPEFVIHAAWQWVGVVFVVAATGALLLLVAERRRSPAVFIGMLLLAASIAAPLNQARIGTSASLQKHVVFGAWFGCIIGGYGLNRLLRSRWVACAVAFIVLFGMSALYMNQAYDLFQGWGSENPTFIIGLKRYVHPNEGNYLIEGYADVPAFYVGPSVMSLQWKESGAYSYLDPHAGAELHGPAAVAAAIQNKAFSAIIINFASASAVEIADDNAVPAAIAKFGGYRIAGKIPPSTSDSHAAYTVWERVGG